MNDNELRSVTGVTRRWSISRPELRPDETPEMLDVRAECLSPHDLIGELGAVHTITRHLSGHLAGKVEVEVATLHWHGTEIERTDGTCDVLKEPVWGEPRCIFYGASDMVRVIRGAPVPELVP